MHEIVPRLPKYLLSVPAKHWQDIWKNFGGEEVAVLWLKVDKKLEADTESRQDFVKVSSPKLKGNHVPTGREANGDDVPGWEDQPFDIT